MMDPSCNNQDNVMCTLCRRAVATMYCKNCVEKQLSDKTKVWCPAHNPLAQVCLFQCVLNIHINGANCNANNVTI